MAYYIGIDLDGTNIKAGVVTEAGAIMTECSVKTLAQRPYQDIVRDMAACVMSVLKQANLTTADIAAIGVGIPGVADQKQGRVIFCTNLG